MKDECWEYRVVVLAPEAVELLCRIAGRLLASAPKHSDRWCDAHELLELVGCAAPEWEAWKAEDEGR